MDYDPRIHQRRSMRLQGYDYASPGAYFVTIVTYQRQQIFGESVNGVMNCSKFGEIVREEWMRSIGVRKEIHLYDDEFVVMPNHVHAIIWLVSDDDNFKVGADGVCLVSPKRGAWYAPQQATSQQLKQAPRSLGSFIAGYKASVTSRAGREINMTGIWQRNYYDHIIRNEKEYERIYAYIEGNHLNWLDDEENSAR